MGGVSVWVLCEGWMKIRPRDYEYDSRICLILSQQTTLIPHQPTINTNRTHIKLKISHIAFQTGLSEYHYSDSSWLPSNGLLSSLP